MKYLGILVLVMTIFMIGISISQPATAVCKTCEAARQRAAESSVTAMAVSATLADNIGNGTALNASISEIARATNMSRNQIERIANATGININEINISDVKAASKIIGSRIVEGVRENLAPVLERIRNRTVYNLNNTPIINIAKDLRLRVRPVEMEHEHIQINGSSLVVHNITNPVLNIELRIEKDGKTIERNMTITRTDDNNRLKIAVKGTEAVTDTEIVYENGQVYISKLDKTIELKTLPDKIQEKVQEVWHNRAEIREIKLEMAKERLKYVVKTRTKKNIIGIIPADVDEESDVDADSGEVESTRGPWWGFLAW